jgi:CTLH/CRA C-terminal to LisH motif domain
MHAGVTEALRYAQVHLSQFQGDFMPQIKQLMGRLLYSHHPLGDTPYGHLDEKALLEEVATDFTKATCRILGQVCFLVWFLAQ